MLGVRIRLERPAGWVCGGGLTVACQGRIVVVVVFGRAKHQLDAKHRPVVVDVEAVRGQLLELLRGEGRR